MQSPSTFSLSTGVVSTLAIPIERLCARAGVATSNAWVTDDFFRIWAAAEEEFHDPCAGLQFGEEGIARGYGVGAIVALHAPDFRSALAALSRYKSLTCPELVEVEAKGGEAVVRYRWLQATGPVPRLLVDITMASLRQLAWRGTDGKVTPIRLELTRRPLDEALLRRHFGWVPTLEYVSADHSTISRYGVHIGKAEGEAGWAGLCRRRCSVMGPRIFGSARTGIFRLDPGCEENRRRSAWRPAMRHPGRRRRAEQWRVGVE